MQTERRILRNTVLLSGGQALGQLANLVFVASFARTYGADSLGAYSFGMAIGALAALFVGLGTQGYLVRELSRSPERTAERIGLLAPVHLLSAIVVWLVGSALGILLFSPSAAVGVILGACAYQVIWRASGLLYVPFRAVERMHLPAAAEVGHRLIVLGAGLVAIRLGASAAVTLLVLPVSALCYAGFGWWRTSSDFGSPRWRFAPAETLQVFRAASPFFGVIVLSVLYARGAIVMLGALGNETAVGLYAAADRVLIAAMLLPNMFNASVFPALTRLQHSDPPKAMRLAIRSLILLAAAGVPLAFGLSFFATDILRLVFGPDYQGAVTALQLLAWTVPAHGAQVVLGSLLVAMDRQTEMARARLLGVIVFVALGVVMIRFAGITGLAGTVLICEVFQLLVYVLLLRSSSRVSA